jgi:hypothetical protein
MLCFVCICLRLMKFTLVEGEHGVPLETWKHIIYLERMHLKVFLLSFLVSFHSSQLPNGLRAWV